MSEENVELVRRALDAWNQQDEETALQLFSPDAELDASGRILNPDIYTGIDGLMRFRRDIAEAWDRFEVEIEDLFDSGSLVVVFVRSLGKGRASGIEVDFRSAWQPPACRSSWRPPLWTKSGYRRRRMSG